MPRTLTESEAERIADRRVQSRMRTDRAYIHAEDAESQHAAEERIEAEVIRDMRAEYDIPSWPEA